METMLHLKKYFTEGLIQMAIQLSLCGVRVDVGLKLYLPPSWYEMMPGQTSAQTPFHNLRNQRSRHPKSVDLEQFFTARRLLGFVHSLDRIQVPQTELETWLVHREPGPLLGGLPDQPSLMDRAPGETERLQSDPTTEQGAALASLEEEERTGDDRSREWECQSSNMLCENQPLALELELQWQDLMDVLEPENTDVEVMTSLSHSPPPRTPLTVQGDGPEPLAQYLNTTAGRVANQTDPPTGILLPQNLSGIPVQLEQEPVLLPLTPSDELVDLSSSLNTGLTLENSHVDSWIIPSNYTDLLAENPVEGFDKDVDGEVTLTNFGLNSLTEDVSTFASECHLWDLESPGCSRASEGSHLNLDFGITSPSVLSEEDPDGLPRHISDLFEDFNILEDINVLDEALGGFSPQMEERPEEEGKAWQRTARRGNHVEDHRQPERKEDDPVESDSDACLALNSPRSLFSPIMPQGSAEDSSSSSVSIPSSSSCASAVENLFSEEADCSDEEDSAGSDLEVEVTIKQEEMEELGFSGHGIPLFCVKRDDCKPFHGLCWLEHVGHDHTYHNQPLSPLSPPARGRRPSKQTKSAVRHDKARPYHRLSRTPAPEAKTWSRDEQRARELRIPFSYELIVNLPVEEFNDLLTNYQLSREQLTLIRDIRRRGKNKMAAQNCRKRKQDVLLALEHDLKALRRHHSQLLQEKQDGLSHLRDMRRRFGTLYQEIFSKLMDDCGRPLDAAEYMLEFGPNDAVTVASLRANQSSKRHRDVKKRRC